MSTLDFRATSGRLLASACLAFAFPGTAWAEEGRDDERAETKQNAAAQIVVTGESLKAPEGVDALPVQVLSGEELVHRRQAGLGETLAGLPGVHLDNFGGGASRPVIRGQTVPRIEILTDGANLFDVSSVSPDHAITTDPLLLDAIEIQRGPAAVRYGGNAVNGAINLIDSKVPKAIPVGGFTGATEVRYGTGDEEKTIVGRVTAGVGQFAIHAEGARRKAGNYDVPDSFGSDRLRDSFAENTTYALGASWITSKGYIGAAYSRTDSEYGLPGHSHLNGVCHTHGLDLHCEAHDEFEDPFGSPDSHTASIELRSERAEVRADYEDLLPGFSHVRLRGSYTDYVHDEIDGPSLFSRYSNEVYDARLELTHKPVLGFTGTMGVQYTDGTFSGLNVSTLHQGGYTRNYETETIGVFLSERRSFGPVDVEIAARQDWRTIEVPLVPYQETVSAAWWELLQTVPSALEYQLDLHATNWARFNPEAEHKPFSASAGATWNIGSGYSASLSLGRTERAPGVRELYAYGNNLATNSYEVGLSQTQRMSSELPESTTDVMETTKSIDLTFRKSGGPLGFEVGLFYQDIDDYIFARLIETEAESGTPHNLLVYTAADARFAGIDGQIDYQISPSSSLTVFGDYVDAKLKSEADNLPRIPPARLGARYEYASGPLSGDVEYFHTFAQDEFASYETRTDGYGMLNATLSYRFEIDDRRGVEFYARATSLTNELAFSHTSFVKEQSPLRGRSVAIGMRHQF